MNWPNWIVALFWLLSISLKRYFPSSFFWREKVHTCQQSVTILGIVFRYICSFRLLLEPRRKTLVGYIIITASRHLPGAALKRDFSFWVFFFLKMDHYSALCTVFQKFDGIINWWCLLVSGPFFNQNILVPNFQIRRKYFSLSLLQFLCILAW